MQKEEDIIGYDFQGWPIYKMTLREFIEELGFEKISNRGVDYWQISDKNPILDLYPRTLEDDSMGYGINEQVIVCSSIVERNNKPEFINIFIDKARNKGEKQ